MGGILGAALAAVLCLAWGGAALADSIDGDWCYKDGRRFSIDGPNFTTPGGNKILGEYGRYAYLRDPEIRGGRRSDCVHGLHP